MELHEWCSLICVALGITAGRASALLSWGQSLDDDERHETGEHLAAEAILHPMLFVYFSEAATCNLLVHDTDHQSIKGLTWTLIVILLKCYYHDFSLAYRRPQKSRVTIDPLVRLK